jgi:hypothetical protein
VPRYPSASLWVDEVATGGFRGFWGDHRCHFMLRVVPLSIQGTGGFCNTPHTVTVTVNPSITLAAGTYTGQVVLISTSMAMTVPVTLTIAPPATPFFDNVAGQMSFSMKIAGLAPPAQIIELRNGGSGGFLDWTLTATTSDGGNWLIPSATNGTAPSTISVAVSVANLPNLALTAGTFTGQLLFHSSGSRVTVPISIVVGPDVFNQVNAINFTKLLAGPNPLPPGGYRTGKLWIVPRAACV